MPNALFIIGMGPGIGAATAERFAREGWTIILGSRSPDKLKGYIADLEAIGAKAQAVTVDATDPAKLRAAVAEADRLSGGLTAVHFNAAYVRHQDLFSMTDAEVASDLAVNVAGGLNTVRAAVEQFEGRKGVILVTGGGLALAPHAEWSSLGVGKAALRNLVQGLAPDLAARGIRIAIATVSTLVAPGSDAASGVADTFWTLATADDAPWEATYPKFV